MSRDPPEAFRGLPAIKRPAEHISRLEAEKNHGLRGASLSQCDLPATVQAEPRLVFCAR